MQLWGFAIDDEDDPAPDEDGRCAYMNVVNRLLEDDGTFCARKIRSSFLRFWVELLGKYRAYLPARIDDEEAKFDKVLFVAEAPTSARVLLTRLMGTQLFSQFSHGCPHEHILFFDEVTVAVTAAVTVTATVTATVTMTGCDCG